MDKVIKVLDFSEYPGPRYISQGLDSGELFYEEVLKDSFNEAVEKKIDIVVDLDYTAGYSPSFIDEVFGNLVYDFDWIEIENRLKIKSDQEPDWNQVILEKVFPQWRKKKNEGHPRKPNDL
jgi:hypothetical protein